MNNTAYEATNSDVEKPLSEEHERPSKILFIIAARIARREHLRPLHALSELNQKTIGTRALNQMIEQVEESLLRESGKLVRVAEKYEELKIQNAELARRIAELEVAPNGMMQLSNELEDGELTARALALYKPPFKFMYGYIHDGDGQVVADNNVDADNQVLRVRGWGRISYMENAEALRDEVGEVIAIALTEYWKKKEAL